MSVDVRLIVLVTLALAVAVVIQRNLIPRALALVLAGIIATLFPPMGADLSPDVLLALFIPGLMFGLALRINVSDARRIPVGAIMLGIPGLVLAAGITALLVWLALGSLADLSVRWALVFACVLAVVDSSTFLSALQRLQLPRGLLDLVRGEAVLTGIVTVVLFTVVASIVGAWGSDLVVRMGDGRQLDEAALRRVATHIETSVDNVSAVRLGADTASLRVVLHGEAIGASDVQRVTDAASRAGVHRAEIRVQRRAVPPSIFWILRELVLKTLAGLALGLVFGFGFRWLTTQLKNSRLEPLLGLVCAYGAYLLAQGLQSSGIVAVAVAGLTIRARPKTIELGTGGAGAQAQAFWDNAETILSILAVLVAGSLVGVGALLHHAHLAIITWVAVIASRFVAVNGCALILGGQPDRIERGWVPLLFWGGTRGAMVLVLALVIPMDMAEQSVVLPTILGVVLFSLAIQGLSLPSMARWLGLGVIKRIKNKPERLRGRILASVRARQHLNRLHEEHAVTPRSYELLARAYDHKIAVLERDLAAFYEDDDSLRQEELTLVLREMLRAEREDIDRSFARGYISEHIHARLLNQVQTRQSRLTEEVDLLGPRPGDRAGSHRRSSRKKKSDKWARMAETDDT